MKWRLTVIYLIGMVAEIIVRTPYERRRNQLMKIDQRVSLAERGLLTWMTLGMFLLPLAYGLMRRLDFADYRLSSAARGRTGGAWRVRARRGGLALLAPTSRPRGELVTLIGDRRVADIDHGGVYRTIRHPIYTPQLPWGGAQASLLPNWLCGLGGLVAFLLLYFVRVPREEQMMRDHFGDAYRDYAAQTGRVLLRLWGTC